MANDGSVLLLYVARGRQNAMLLAPTNALLAELRAKFEEDKLPRLQTLLVTSQKDAITATRSAVPTVVAVEILDGHDRYNFCDIVRHRWPSARLLGISAISPLPLSLRLDERLPYPPKREELFAVLYRMLSRTDNDHIVTLGPVSLDLHTRIVRTPRGQHHVTPKQSALLQLFMARHGEVISRRELMEEIWETSFLGDTRTLDVHIRWLREQIEIDPSNPRYLVTVRGRGYRLCLD
ncbi:MAG: helix-turn-helix domain-containing protein [Caldilinea sp.]|nr:winged helix-turn-helix domain-containing protein [Caldilinea sp.]MCB0057657.1 winged helix-turn-helix domain-containing protein [Caldilineaceae bacterium]MCB0041883.1 winged helix-turn-helix domain-containing protein [Caldilinea sp.]MCB0067778.1 winged helix-turn-helix domain-containing protein [Caldilineaceae bacterium]MCB0147991.1 winged helix-turn-helix domain-containing protein [Caldilineaceae bacterium]